MVTYKFPGDKEKNGRLDFQFPSFQAAERYINGETESRSEADRTGTLQGI